MVKDKFKALYFNGSSFTEGGGLNEQTIEFYNSKGFDVIGSEEKDFAYPSFVHKQFPTLRLYNDAQCGGGLDRLIRNVYEFIERSGIEYSRKTLFILELPHGFNRLDFYSNHYKKHLIVNVNANHDLSNIEVGLTENYLKPFKISTSLKNKMIQIIKDWFIYFNDTEIIQNQNMNSLIGLFSYMKILGLEFYLSGNNVENFFQKAKFLENNKINFDENKLNLNVYGEVYSDIFKFAQEKQLTISHEMPGNDDGHPGLNAHILWADAIVNFLNRKYL